MLKPIIKNTVVKSTWIPELTAEGDCDVYPMTLDDLKALAEANGYKLVKKAKKKVK